MRETYLRDNSPHRHISRHVCKQESARLVKGTYKLDFVVVHVRDLDEEFFSGQKGRRSHVASSHTHCVVVPFFSIQFLDQKHQSLNTKEVETNSDI